MTSLFTQNDFSHLSTKKFPDNRRKSTINTILNSFRLFCCSWKWAQVWCVGIIGRSLYSSVYMFMDNIESLRNFSKSLVTLVTGCYSFYIFSLLQPTYRLCTGNIDDNCIIIMAENIKISNVQQFSIIQCFIYTIHTSICV